jgi:hypothetical protein
VSEHVRRPSELLESRLFVADPDGSLWLVPRTFNQVRYAMINGVIEALLLGQPGRALTSAELRDRIQGHSA